MKKITTAFLSLFIFALAFGQDKPEGLFINSKAPDFKANDQNDVEVNMKDLRKKGNVVVVFYRGYWDPYGNRFMKKLQDSLSVFKANHTELVVITPETKDCIDSSIAKTAATFSVLHDKDMKIANGYKVSFRVDDKAVARYKNATPSIDLLKINNQTKEAYLPVPAVYIVNTDGAVIFRFFEEDYKKQVAIADIVKALNGEK